MLHYETSTWLWVAGEIVIVVIVAAVLMWNRMRPK